MMYSVLLLLATIIILRLDAKKVIILNALDSSSLGYAIEFSEKIKLEVAENAIMRAFTWKESFDEETPENQSKLRDKFDIKFYSSKPLPNVGIGRPNPPDEHVTCILESLEAGLAMAVAEKDALLAVSFSKTSRPMPTENFSKIFEKIAAGQDLLLLEKNRRMTSVSDWHDFSVILMSSEKGAQTWLKTFREVFNQKDSR